MYRFNVISIKIPASDYLDTGKLILKLVCQGKRPRIANTTLKENKVGGLTLPNNKTYYVATVINAI